MDLLGYAAFSGVERVAIIGGALVIGYWGYRLYGRDKTPGLIFMGIACAVLIASLATGGSHMRSVGASYQLAGGASGPEAGGELLGADAPEMSADVEAADPSQAAPFQDGQTDAASSSAEISAELSPKSGKAITRPGGSDGRVETSAIASTQPETVGVETPDASLEPDPAEDSASEVTLASSRELGGRIVSIKSESVTLEWSKENDDAAAP